MLGGGVQAQLCLADATYVAVGGALGADNISNRADNVSKQS
jgi:hypothetical protein